MCHTISSNGFYKTGGVIEVNARVRITWQSCAGMGGICVANMFGLPFNRPRASNPTLRPKPNRPAHPANGQPPIRQVRSPMPSVEAAALLSAHRPCRRLHQSNATEFLSFRRGHSVLSSSGLLLTELLLPDHR